MVEKYSILITNLGGASESYKRGQAREGKGSSRGRHPSTDRAGSSFTLWFRDQLTLTQLHIGYEAAPATRFLPDWRCDDKESDRFIVPNRIPMGNAVGQKNKASL